MNDLANTKRKNDFAVSASSPRTGFLSEITAFLMDNKKWWLVPIMIAMLLLGAFVFLAGTGAAPFIYTLF